MHIGYFHPAIAISPHFAALSFRAIRAVGFRWLKQQPFFQRINTLKDIFAAKKNNNFGLAING
jgi:hypothetical protein